MSIYLTTTTATVNEVSEAIARIKGYNASQLINLEFSTTVDPADPRIHEGLVAYQNIVFPDINACLARRSHLIAQLGREERMDRLALGLSKNFSLRFENFAGLDRLKDPIQQTDGFVDLNGEMSGIRRSYLLRARRKPMCKRRGRRFGICAEHFLVLCDLQDVRDRGRF